MKLSMIVARSIDDVIGQGNSIPWGYPSDLQNFKKITSGSGKAVAMGRKTWESLPKKPLPDRLNIVITSDPKNIDVDNENVIVVSTIDDAIEVANKLNVIELFFIGGATIYNKVVYQVDEVHLTEIDLVFPESPSNVLFDYVFWLPNIWEIKSRHTEYNGTVALYEYYHLSRIR